MRRAGIAGWLVALVLALASPARAEERVIVVAEGEEALTALLVPPGGRTVVCSGTTCPTGLEQVEAEDIHLDVDGSRGSVSGRVIVDADVPFLGVQRLRSRVTCSGRPEIDGAGVLRIREPSCSVGDLPGLATVVGELVARELAAREIDVLAMARDGFLSAHDPDPRLSRRCASSCVVSVALGSPLAHAGRPRIVLRVTLRDAGCCPAR
jgi:hypothetical protein